MRKLFGHPLVLSLLIISSLTLLNHRGLLKVPQDILYKTIAPIQNTTYKLSSKASSLIKFLASIGELYQENGELKQENTELLSEIVHLRDVVQENELLREQIGLPKLGFEEMILADIIGQDLSNLGKYFLINKGEKDGIRKDAAVIAAGNVLVGQVVETTASFSKVRSITDPNSRINALIQESSVTGLVKGERESDLIFDLIPQGEIIEKGNIVVTSGLAGLFPPGLLIGQIRRVISSDIQIAQMAKVKPAVDFNGLKKVFVIDNPVHLIGLSE